MTFWSALRPLLHGLLCASLGVVLAVSPGRARALGGAGGDPEARAALLQGRVGDAVKRLRTDLSREDAPANHLLLCRAYLAEDLLTQAIEECETSAKAQPTSDAFTWLGRTYGAKASRVSPLSAFALARHVHASFERAVELDPRSVAALNDLGEFSVKAPAIVGGDLDRARELARQLAPLSEATSHRLLALIARKQHDSVIAERELLAGVAAASPAEMANANINLAQFYVSSGRTDLAVQAARAAVSADPAGDDVLVDAASILSEVSREPDAAIQYLRRYVTSPARSDAAPAFKARLQLADLLQASGDGTAAAQQRRAAHLLAPDFIPAHPLSAAASESQRVR